MPTLSALPGRARFPGGIPRTIAPGRHRRRPADELRPPQGRTHLDAQPDRSISGVPREVRTSLRRDDAGSRTGLHSDAVHLERSGALDDLPAFLHPRMLVSNGAMAMSRPCDLHAQQLARFVDELDPLSSSSVLDLAFVHVVPRCAARPASCVRLARPSLRRMLLTWVFTVARPITSRSAISGLV